ncbi:hypothetical protein DYB32_003606 [Aphanomyces invadans]|uniref:Uncharacterized protein n=1 Tax=Aphanomyces invadans TaxID=157072 RepID=A0A3R6WNM9_9STRA|nr:hypothetical protein DYB32_003606 [Aphanomyces invadans]
MTCVDEDNNKQLSIKHQHTSMGGEGSDDPAAQIPIKLPLRMGCAVAEDDVNVLDKSRSLRPKKPHAQGTRSWHMHQHAKQSLAQGLDVLDAVKLPPGFGREEWIAVHAHDFFNEVSLLYGTISELCTATTCPEMTAGPCYTYLWADDHGGSPVACSAPAYVAKLMAWIDAQLSDPTVFPDSGYESNKAFAAMSRNMFKRLFRVYAHIYHNHEPDFATLHAESHLKCSFKRFVSFVLEFDLVEAKELNALRKLICDLVPGKL